MAYRDGRHSTRRTSAVWDRVDREDFKLALSPEDSCDRLAAQWLYLTTRFTAARPTAAGSGTSKKTTIPPSPNFGLCRDARCRKKAPDAEAVNLKGLPRHGYFFFRSA
jgi:hypothetical protein